LLDAIRKLAKQDIIVSHAKQEIIDPQFAAERTKSVVGTLQNS